MTLQKKQKSQRGFSLTEVIVATAVFAIIFIAALLVYDRANRIFKTGMDASDVQQTTRVAFDRMVAELRMAGFDFDRDGYPTGAKKYQQPDEQLEFIHPHAVTIRTNLNYETAAANDNGRETAYEPGFTTTSTADDFFPVVTTANNEIVTYVLKSDSGPNDDTITFSADVARPRRSYPEPGGANETTVTIPNVDLCQDNAGVLTGCLNPPYTLYRIALKDDGTPDTPVPIANNIRSMSFSYFADALSTVAVTPNGGTGQYIVIGGSTPAASITARELRSGIRSIRLSLVGMSPGTDSAYVDPIEAALPVAQQVASARPHRQYQLQSAIVPRNLGKRGVQEIDINVPGAPYVTMACHGGCGVALVKWDAPPIGYVDSYAVIHDTSPTGAFNSPPTDAGRNLFAYVSGLTPGATYYFKVIAKNAFGSGISINYGGPITVLNRTQPQAPTIVSATGNPSGPAGTANDITLAWDSPLNNMSPSSQGTTPTWSCGDPAGAIPSTTSKGAPYTDIEVQGYRIYRSTTSGFTPSASTLVWQGFLSDAGAPTLTATQLTYVDSTAKLACTPYYYKVQAYERCAANAALNQPNNTAMAVSPISNEMEGQSPAGAIPKAPLNAVATVASTCSTNPCSISMEWDEVVQDVNDKPVLIAQYNVRRRTFVGGFYVAGSDETFPVTDPNPGDGARMTFTDTTAPAPPLGTIYHYNIQAQQCGGASVGAFSTPDIKFPCAIITTNIDPTTVLDGDGSAGNPWLIGNDTASITVTSNTDLVTASATVYDYPARTSSFAASGGITGNPRVALFDFSMTGSNGVFEVVIQLTDNLGCGTTVTRYVQESPTSCCLIPYKDSSGAIFDATVMSHNADLVTLTLKNQCDQPLDIETLRLTWNIGQPNDLESVTYPGGFVDNLGGGDADGTAIVDPATAGASTIIPANGTYRVILRFDRSNRTSINTVINFCARYNRGANVVLETCRVAQLPGNAAGCP